ncbi:MAG: hypothetical protein OEW15_05985 [Nitrospirota bacterium]|nr:hypothetical protein [Nitrospirota bacterium]
MALDLESRLRGTRRGHITLEFFTNSAHFPIANMFLELLHEGAELILKPDLYVTLSAAIAQAFYLGTWKFAGTPRPFLGNLIGPAVYTIAETVIEGPAFFGSLSHIAYILFSVVIGLLQEVRLTAGNRAQQVIYIVENVVRTSILPVMYWIFEAADDPKYATLAGFVSDGSHMFIMLSLVFIGAILGLADVIAESYQSILRETAHELRKYSEWFLGRDLLDSAVADPTALSIRRRERTMVFMDIRGFTGWSETQSPEMVVEMWKG